MSSQPLGLGLRVVNPNGGIRRIHVLDGGNRVTFRPAPNPVASMMPTVVICDEHRLFVEVLATALGSQGFVVASTEGRQVNGIDSVARFKPDVYVTDVTFTGEDGVLSLKTALASSSRTRALVLSRWFDPEISERVRTVGGYGFVTKSAPLERIVVAIERVASGGTYFDSTPEWGSVRRSHRASQASPFRCLTDKERFVLQGLVRGKSTVSLAADMDVSCCTVRTHVRNVLAKLGVHSRLAAVALVAQGGDDLVGLA